MSVTAHQVYYLGTSNGEVPPIADRRIYDFIARGESGVVAGCTVTNPSGNTLNIATGWGIARGCIFSIANESVTAEVASAGTQGGKLVLHIDTTNSTAEFETRVNDISPMEEDDLTTSEGVFEIQFAEYDIDTAGTISDLTETYATVEPLTAPPFEFGIDNNGNYGYIKIGENVVTPFDLWDVVVPRGYALTSNDGIKAISGGSVSAGSAYGAYIIANVGGMGFTSVTRANGQGAIRFINYDGTTDSATGATRAMTSAVKWVLAHRTASSQAAVSLSFS